MSIESSAIGDAPVQLDQEWANALTHGIAMAGALTLGTYLTLLSLERSMGLAVACGAYSLSVAGTFLCSTLSHSIHRQPLLNRLRAWDQAMIYLMIAGTYTPIAFRYADDVIRYPLLVALWFVAFLGFLAKILAQHRVNSVAMITYLLLGWLPAIPLVGVVPMDLVWSMIFGGVLYSIGVLFLKNDRKFKYAHAVWHLIVMSAATCHWTGILWYVVK